MSVDSIPFVAVTMPALAVHMVAVIVAHFLEPEHKGDTVLERWWAPAQMARLLTLRRTDLKWSAIWVLIVVSRVALVVALISFVLDLVIN